MKTREFIERYQKLKDFKPRYILELGIFQGVSIVLFDNQSYLRKKQLNQI